MDEWLPNYFINIISVNLNSISNNCNSISEAYSVKQSKYFLNTFFACH